MNGFSVCNKLKKDPALKDVPLIIMSSESSDETFEQHRKLRTRAEDYVHKPITWPDLLAHIQPLVAIAGDVGAQRRETSASRPPQSIDLEAIEDDEIVIEEMSSKPPPRMTSQPPAAATISERPPSQTNEVPHLDMHAQGNGQVSLE